MPFDNEKVPPIGIGMKFGCRTQKIPREEGSLDHCQDVFKHGGLE